MKKKLNIDNLEKKAQWVWSETLKIHKLSPETRVASSLSPIEIFVCLYYGGFINYSNKDPLWSDRDRFIVSKGHGSLSMYPILADLGYFSISELSKVCTSKTFLGGIPDPIIPGYETINGSLGHGVGVGTGIAIALKTQKKKNKVFVVTGDGELHEGSVWEAFMFAGQHELCNLNVIVDNNHISMLGKTDEIVSIKNLDKIMNELGWEVLVVNKGHSIPELINSLKKLTNSKLKKPKLLITHTNKGNKVPGLEGQPLSHVTGIPLDKLEKLIDG